MAPWTGAALRRPSFVPRLFCEDGWPTPSISSGCRICGSCSTPRRSSEPGGALFAHDLVQGSAALASGIEFPAIYREWRRTEDIVEGERRLLFVHQGHDRRSVI